jgi:hypothetical protein
MRRWFFVLLLVILCGVALPGAHPAMARPNTGPGGGWVKANVVGGGCDNQGHCSSEVKPGSPALYEYKPDRDPVARNEAPGGADHGGYPTFEQRDQCNYLGQILGWAAGIWHRGGYWTLTYDAAGNERWSGPARQHWAFEHLDDCLPKATATPTLPPPPTATQPPGQPTWTPLPPTAPPPPTVPPTPTPIPGGVCRPDGLPDDDPSHIHPEYSIWSPRISGVPLPKTAPGLQIPLPPGATTVDVDFSFSQNPMAAGDPRAPYNDTYGWNHQDIRLSGNWNGNGGMRWDYEKYTDHGNVDDMLTIDNQFTHGFSNPSPGRWRPLPRMDANRAPISFATSYSGLPPGQYTITSKTYRDACNPSYREEKFYFWVGNNPITPTPAATATPQPSPTPLPPAPPVPAANFQLSIHSTLDPNSNDSNPSNAVYRSTGNTISWPAGEVLDFTPRVRMTLSPSAPSYPGYAYRAKITGWSFVSSLGLKADTNADGLSRTGCRGSGRAGTNSLNGCEYAYIGGASLSDSTEPTDSQMANQAHVYWAASKPGAMRNDIYTYVVSPLRKVDLVVEVRIVVEVVNVALNQVVDSETRVVRGAFNVNLVVPRSVK